jgi:biopolymer transport protein ExbD
VSINSKGQRKVRSGQRAIGQACIQQQYPHPHRTSTLRITPIIIVIIIIIIIIIITTTTINTTIITTVLTVLQTRSAVAVQAALW